MKTTVSVVRRPEGGRKGRNGAEEILLGPNTVDVPSNYPTEHQAPPPMGAYSFAFWWVANADSGNFISLNNNVEVVPGNVDMVAKAWFTRTDIAPATGSNILVDAFDVEKGRFLDDDFVVVNDEDYELNPPLTEDANTNGIVSTQSKQLIDAYATIGIQKFDRWEIVRGQESITGGKVTALKDSNAEAIAFYTGSKKDSQFYYEIGDLAAQTWVSWGVKVDGGGPTGGGPVPPWDPLMWDVAAGMALAEAANKLDPTLRSEALKIAARQITMSSKKISQAMEAAAEHTKKTKR